jgi:hypothetical protein
VALVRWQRSPAPRLANVSPRALRVRPARLEPVVPPSTTAAFAVAERGAVRAPRLEGASVTPRGSSMGRRDGAPTACGRSARIRRGLRAAARTRAPRRRSRGGGVETDPRSRLVTLPALDRWPRFFVALREAPRVLARSRARARMRGRKPRHHDSRDANLTGAGRGSREQAARLSRTTGLARAVSRAPPRPTSGAVSRGAGAAPQGRIATCAQLVDSRRGVLISVCKYSV